MASLHIDRRADELAAAAVVANYPADMLLTTGELARWLGVSEISIKRWISAGCGPKAIRTGLRALRFRKSDVQSWLESRAVKAGA